MASKGGKLLKIAAVTVARAKGKQVTGLSSISPSSNLGKFFGIPAPKRAELDVLVYKFVKLYRGQGRGMKKGAFTEEKLKDLLSGKDKIGIPEIVKLMSGQI
ncbi:PREDICTED: uncharacterized protein LOC104798526 isoform X2 [Tarenaya hassleriana]|uniref:uncharacterized protein LOC104798526 isoform X1 n=1 Tax=Tarenaya hassleriana TaxID=28532 RepID=UPI00053C7F2E|nr:PREDICTED: uncharacterized protein LOC104798526 isoform X1 [Tarenaya hassleriana]XP_019056247.1 PREDICTED: uncharacterized protein LOC104798526 isoform X2 [Tarenaya hassleriana]